MFGHVGVGLLFFAGLGFVLVNVCLVACARILYVRSRVELSVVMFSIRIGLFSQTVQEKAIFFLHKVAVCSCA